MTIPLVAPKGGFTLSDIWHAYAKGAQDAKQNAKIVGIDGITEQLIQSACDAYVKSVAVSLPAALLRGET